MPFAASHSRGHSTKPPSWREEDVLKKDNQRAHVT